jgi:hypothetical protein
MYLVFIGISLLLSSVLCQPVCQTEGQTCAAAPGGPLCSWDTYCSNVTSRCTARKGLGEACFASDTTWGTDNCAFEIYPLDCVNNTCATTAVKMAGEACDMSDPKLLRGGCLLGAQIEHPVYSLYSIPEFFDNQDLTASKTNALPLWLLELGAT